MDRLPHRRAPGDRTDRHDPKNEMTGLDPECKARHGSTHVYDPLYHTMACNEARMDAVIKLVDRARNSGGI